MLPVIAIVGRPNVGKSTLFNRLTKTRAALVSDISGLTRDRQYGLAQHHGKDFIVIDTGGLATTDVASRTTTSSAIDKLIAKQSWQAVLEAQIILFVVDARSGLTLIDEEVVEKLRKIKKDKTIFLIANKVDGLSHNNLISANAEFHSLGLDTPRLISAEHGDGIKNLLDDVVKQFPSIAAINAATLPPAMPTTAHIAKPTTEQPLQPQPSLPLQQAPEAETEAESETKPKRSSHARIKIAFIGRPNVGKSTLINRILGEERVIVSDQSGTTRDSIFVDFTRHGKPYTLIDTAGIRRRGRVTDKIEKFSIVKSLQAIEAANVVVLVLDAQENVTEQDLHLLGFAIESGKAIIIAINKWDGLTPMQREKIRRSLDRRLTFVDFAPMHFISALHGTGVGNLFPSINKSYASAMRQIKTPEATKILLEAVETCQPPLVKGRRIKLRYAHVGGHNPPIIVIHGKQTENVPTSYCKYLERTFRKKLNLVGTPIRIELKTGRNPYKTTA
jgi:GTPase